MGQTAMPRRHATHLPVLTASGPHGVSCRADRYLRRLCRPPPGPASPPVCRRQPPYCAWQLASLLASVPAAATHEVSFEALLSCWLAWVAAAPLTPLVLSCFLA